MKFLKITIGFVAAIAIIVYLFGGGKEEMADRQMQQIENKVADDAIKQYEIAKRGNDQMDVYIHAGLVAAAFLQAKDEENYRKWKAIEKEEAKKAGMPVSMQ